MDVVDNVFQLNKTCFYRARRVRREINKFVDEFDTDRRSRRHVVELHAASSSAMQTLNLCTTLLSSLQPIQASSTSSSPLRAAAATSDTLSHIRSQCLDTKATVSERIVPLEEHNKSTRRVANERWHARKQTHEKLFAEALALQRIGIDRHVSERRAALEQMYQSLAPIPSDPSEQELGGSVLDSLFDGIFGAPKVERKAGKPAAVVEVQSKLKPKTKTKQEQGIAGFFSSLFSDSVKRGEKDEEQLVVESKEDEQQVVEKREEEQQVVESKEEEPQVVEKKEERLIDIETELVQDEVDAQASVKDDDGDDDDELFISDYL
jgi:hypothetical protein